MMILAHGIVDSFNNMMLICRVNMSNKCPNGIIVILLILVPGCRSHFGSDTPSRPIL